MKELEVTVGRWQKMSERMRCIFVNAGVAPACAGDEGDEQAEQGDERTDNVMDLEESAAAAPSASAGSIDNNFKRLAKRRACAKAWKEKESASVEKILWNRPPRSIANTVTAFTVTRF